MELLWIVILLGYAISVVQSIFALTTRRPVIERLSLVSLAVAFGAHTSWLLLQGIRAGRYPLVGTQEMCAFLAWGLVVSYLIAHRWYRAPALKAFIFPIVLTLATVAAITPGVPGRPVGMDTTLERFLFPLHAGLILLAYASFFITFGAGLMYIIQERELKLKRFGTVFYRLPSLDTCDAISFKSMSIGFVLLTFGIAAGIGWQAARDGVYWHGTGLEIFSIFSWLVYLLIIQSRINAGWGGRTAALASIISFMLVIFSLVGVSYLGSPHAFS